MRVDNIKTALKQYDYQSTYGAKNIDDGIIFCVAASPCETGSRKEIVKWLNAMHKN